jgi:hypothetical protein
MGRIRTIKPEFPHSETIGRLSRDARLLFIQLWTIADDSGRTRASSRMLASLLYPYDDDVPKLIEGWLRELADHDCIQLYSVDGSHFLEVTNWLKHQKIDKPSTSKIPPFDEASRIIDEHSTTDLGPVPRTKEEDTSSLRSDVAPRTRKTGQRELPSDWSPSGQSITKGLSLGFSQTEIASIAETMRDWAASKAARKANWDATFNGFLTRDARERKTARPSQQARASPHEKLMQAIVRHVERDDATVIDLKPNGGMLALK